MPSLTPQPGKILDFDTLNFSIVLNTIVMTAGDVAAAQAEEPTIDTGGRDNSVKASTEKAFAVKPTFENATQEALQFKILTLLWLPRR